MPLFSGFTVVVLQADVVRALQLNVRQVVRRLVEEAHMEVRASSVLSPVSISQLHSTVD